MKKINKVYNKLLSREVIIFDKIIENQLNKIYKNKTIVVTGGAGSIGSNLVVNLLKLQPKKILIIDNNEISLVNLKKKIKNKKCNFYLSDVSRDYIFEMLFKKFKIDFLFHTAAYKHVDVLEENVATAIVNNVKSTLNICKICKKYKVELVNVSTDKAVKPISILGYTKRISEIIVSSFVVKYKKLNYYNVRFGNVFNTTGSAIEQFMKQIESNEIITLTDKKMKRFFMTNDEASYLILSPPLVKKTGYTFIYDMGEEIKIYDLIKKLSITTKKNLKKIRIKIIGKRKGEKLNEILSNKKKFTKTNLERVWIINDNDFNQDKKFLSKISQLINKNRMYSTNKELLKKFYLNI